MTRGRNVDAAEAERETSSNGHVQGGDTDHDDDDEPAWDPKTQPSDISEEEAIAMALANSELEELNKLAMWDGLAIQLRESALASDHTGALQ
ncbi:hypothetical protein QYE76_027284 [Lolium multiflorum]|uniref:Uncharacterized protein n=1 Tax=Lolium multiflorum TaxID=4521 RepID=A0AAD8VFC6_LOLMU|nr:hypothetical protein QYE76_027284 [Lolium multiflorum]